MVLSAGDKNKMQQQHQIEDVQSKYKSDLLLAKSEKRKAKKEKRSRKRITAALASCCCMNGDGVAKEQAARQAGK